MSYQYAVVSNDEQSVVERRSYAEPLAADQIKKLPNGHLMVRPFVDESVLVPAFHDEQIVTTIEADRVARTNIVTIKPNAAQLTALRDIAALEQQITNRRIREAALTQEGKDWLAAKDAQIAALRAML